MFLGCVSLSASAQSQCMVFEFVKVKMIKIFDYIEFKDFNGKKLYRQH